MILLLLLPVALILLCGCASLLLGRLHRAAHDVGSIGIGAASLLGLLVSLLALASGDASGISLPWNTMIGASFSVGMDPLTGFFLLPIYGLAAVCALFGRGYWEHLGGTRSLGAPWFFYAVLVASMAMVTLARNAVLFLVAWEVMALSSWLLVTFEHEREEVRQAGITYLVATQIGTAFLLVMFMVLGTAGGPLTADPSAYAVGFAADAPQSAGALDFARFGGIGGPAAAAVFLLALVGFGTKAGIVPLHVWLPEAHPAAPSHVSALMSGVMIKTGIYGLLRVLAFLGAPPAWWGWTLVLVGAVSGVTGVLFALAQHDIKRLLAYHSVENIGIICMGIGVGLLGVSYGMPAVAVIGFAGGLLHVVNHALFKGLLFLGAGAVAHAAGTRDMDRLGGLLKRMPLTGAAFLVAAAAICGLPPLNGFVSELLIFTGAFRAVVMGPSASAAAAGVVVAALALVSGLALACFTKAFGVTFLGEPRSPAAAAAVEARPSMTAAMVMLAAACAGIGLLGSLAVAALAPLAAALAGLPADEAAHMLIPSADALRTAAWVAAALAAAVGLLALLRRLLLSRRARAEAGTWDCGYVKPDARMQYTSSSFAQPLTGTFRAMLATKRNVVPVEGLFPKEASFSTETPDVFTRRVFAPLFSWIASLASRMRWIQHGRLQLYVLYIAAALLILMIWRLG
jgi:hydrogenase-4 component B